MSIDTAIAPTAAPRAEALAREAIRIGTLVQGNAACPRYIEQILEHGFESFQLFFWQSVEGLDLKQLAREVGAVLSGTGVTISSLGIFGNPLAKREKDLETLRGWERCIDAAHAFGCDVVAGFAGRVLDQPIDKSLPVFVETFTPWPSGPRPSAFAWPSRTATWADPGPRATGTSPTRAESSRT